ncbi:MrcB family domain-containing protein, partial [Mogibacterium timidum]|uniref:MrcB family domain-containing protein n=1 Tax=Mogibacterium timidum TaxID=35519 RepID=UPI0028D0D30A
LSEARSTENFKRPFGNLVRRDIAGRLQESITDGCYKVKGSVGAGRWTDVPWIAVFDTRITTSAQRGVYIVYLLNKDTKTLYLTLNQGATDVAQEGGSTKEGKLSFTGIATSNSAKTTEALKERANRINDSIGNRNGTLSGAINSGSTAYDAGCIYYKEYHLDNIPEDAALISDLKLFLELYKRYYEIFVQKASQSNESNPEKKEGEEKVTTAAKDQLRMIKEFIDSKGFEYQDELIENFFLSLKSKPFVILAGTSGTGKSRLVKLFAEAIGAEYKLVSVRPDWSDGSDLFGHYDLNGKFIPGPVCECFETAYQNPEKPVFLCLDEMNLARAEYYLSDFLSVIESREKEADGTIVTSGIAQYEQGIPDNLYIVGTVNMDETTFPFSKKVLDRANTIEFSYVDLIPQFLETSEEAEPVSLKNDFLRTEYQVLTKDCADEADFVGMVCAELQKINEILVKANAHVGYRVRDEIVFYMLNNKKAENLLTYDQAFDNEIMQKILPRLQGSASSVKDMLCELFSVCASDIKNKTGETDAEKMKKILDDTNVTCRFRKSAEKLALMVRRFEEDGFTSYWL